MTPERWRQIETLFQAAVERASDHRATFLQEACAGDEALRQAVISLIASDERARSFIEAPAVAAAGWLIGEPGASVIGQRFGPYEIIRELGRGGMGTVYLAERADDEYQKQVAIKLVKRGMDTDEILRRFRHERQILASLDHPNIARLIDGGTTADGLPYFVMEYIEGVPINEYCDQHKLSTTERLKLFGIVCAAVQYAHQALVVHRDLKPSNILITADGTPKLLDFGIAKLLNPDLSSPTAESTVTGLRPMTPEYASPEQVRGQTITTASDVYSLGVVLYELLTGHRPYYLMSRLPEEVARVICEQEPERPSAVISRTEEVISAQGAGQVTSDLVSETREGTAEKLRRRLTGDLDNIVLMALRKDAPRRYTSAEQLSQDIRRHLEELPVLARKDTFGYRSGKFIQRHKVGVVAAVLLIVTLLGGIVATTWQARVARAERARAEQRFNDVRKLANSFMFEFHDAIRDIAGTVPARQLVVKKALEYLDSLAREASHDLALQRELATAYQRLGEAQSSLYDASVGDTASAFSGYRKALAIREALSAADPKDVQVRNDLAASYIKIGQLLVDSGDTAGGLEMGHKGVALREALSLADPSNTQARFELGSAYRALFVIQANSGNFLTAIESLRKSVEISEVLFTADSSNQQVRRSLVSNHLFFGDQMWLLGRPEAAWNSYRRALTLSEEWLVKEPTSLTAHRAWILSHGYIGNMLVRYGNPSEALEHYRNGVAAWEELAAKDRGNADTSRSLVVGYASIGHALGENNDPAGAVEVYRKKILPGFEALQAADPNSTRYSRDLAGMYVNFGKYLALVGNTTQAVEFARKAQGIFDTLLKQDPNHTEIRRNAALSFFLLAQLLTKTHQIAEARQYLTRALALQKAQADKPEAVGDRVNDYPWSLLTCEPTDMRDPAAALPYAKLAAERTHEKDPNILKTLALAYYLTSDPTHAIETVHKALALLPPHTGGKGDSTMRRELEAQLAKSQAALKSKPAR